MNAPPSTNAQKYATGNPLAAWLIRRFLDRAAQRVVEAAPNTVLDAGCGEGFFLQRLEAVLPSDVRLIGFDLSEPAVHEARQAAGRAELSCQAMPGLDLPDKVADVTACLEVLEHTDDPPVILRELCRVTAGRLVLSVPNEPWFQAAAFCRGKHWSRWGNHPEHIQHWNPRTFRQLLTDAGIGVQRIETVFPWIIAVGTPV